MKAENKFFVKEIFFSGIIFASLMAGFDYSDGKEFVITKFIFHLLFFGLFMGLFFRYQYKKSMSKVNEEK